MGVCSVRATRRAGPLARRRTRSLGSRRRIHQRRGRPPTLDPFLGAGVPGLVPAAGPAFAPAPNAPVRPRTPPVPPDCSVPELHEVVAVPAGVYRLGEPGEERAVALGPVPIGR